MVPLDFKDYFEGVDLSRIDADKIIQYAIDNMDWSGGDGEQFRYQAMQDLYGDKYGYYDNPSGEDEDEVEKRAEEIAREELGDKLEELIWMYRNFEEPLRLYREITVRGQTFEEVVKNIRLLGVGIYWSHDPDAAEAHWAQGGPGYHAIMLYAEVPSYLVDWNWTLVANLSPSLGEEEKEITLKNGIQVPIKKLFVQNKWFDVNFSAHA